MPVYYSQAARALLVLKTKLHQGLSWTEEEERRANMYLDNGGPVSVLAACCVVLIEHHKHFARSLSIVRDAIQRGNLPAFVEETVYEVIVGLDGRLIRTMSQDLVPFIQQSLEKRSVDLSNTFNLLDRLARSGERGAVELLRLLVRNRDPEFCESASAVLASLTDSTS